MTAQNILITGRPGIGKTTLIQNLVERLSDLHPIGFYTRELREGEHRVGFEILGLDGRKGMLAQVQIKSPYHVGKYGVDVRGFDAFLSGMVIPEKPAVVILDEIGKMECLSARFRTLVQNLLDADLPLIATIALRGDSFIQSLKEREDVKLVTLTQENRDLLASYLEEIVRALIVEREG
jgi:nucleoside-triphosphatase